MDSVNPLIVQLTTNREKILRYAFILQFIAAIPFLWVAFITGQTQATLLLRSKSAHGTVVAVVPFRQYKTSASGRLYSRGTSYDVIVEFKPGDEPIRFQDRRGTPFAATAGSPVRVIYDPAHPLTAIMDRGYWNYLPWAPCAVIGGFLALVALKGLLSVLFSQVRSPDAVRG
jgi:hypothetical protein